MLPPLEQIPEPWRSIHQQVIAEEDPAWVEKYGEESLRAAMMAAGDPPLPEG